MKDERVMRRDASFWNSPGWASKFHRVNPDVRGPLGHMVALCDKSIQLEDDTADLIGNVGTLLCKRCAKMK